jgi:hypothetical protein
MSVMENMLRGRIAETDPAGTAGAAASGDRQCC